MKWDIVHRTRYSYATPVRNSFNEVRLKPCSNQEQTLEAFALTVEPATKVWDYNDFYSNTVHHFDINDPHSTLLVESKLRVATHPREPLSKDASPWPLARIGEAARDTRCYEFLESSRYVENTPDVWRLALDATVGQLDTWQAALALMRFVNKEIKYLSNSTTVHTHMRDVLKERQGVCQDFAHVMIGLCRAIKIPALYVSGYLATETASATHAWTEVLIPGIGWRALDPTHDRQCTETYVKIAVGRDYADVPPVTGTYKGTTDRKLEVAVTIRRHDAVGV